MMSTEMRFALLAALLVPACHGSAVPDDGHCHVTNGDVHSYIYVRCAKGEPIVVVNERDQLVCVCAPKLEEN